MAVTLAPDVPLTVLVVLILLGFIAVVVVVLGTLAVLMEVVLAAVDMEPRALVVAIEVAMEVFVLVLFVLAIVEAVRPLA